MATRARSELFCSHTPAEEKHGDVLTCEDMSIDWTDFRSSRETRKSTPTGLTLLTLSRSITVDFDGASTLILSRSASIDEAGHTLHRDDLRAQIRRAFVNICELLIAAGACWSDVVRATCFVRDRTRDGAIFEDELQSFYSNLEIAPTPPSRTVEAILPRPELLVEVEIIAIVSTRR